MNDCSIVFYEEDSAERDKRSCVDSGIASSFWYLFGTLRPHAHGASSWRNPYLRVLAQFTMWQVSSFRIIQSILNGLSNSTKHSQNLVDTCLYLSRGPMASLVLHLNVATKVPWQQKFRATDPACAENGRQSYAEVSCTGALIERINV